MRPAARCGWGEIPDERACRPVGDDDSGADDADADRLDIGLRCYLDLRQLVGPAVVPDATLL